MIGVSAKRLTLCFALVAVTAPAWAEKPNVISLATSSKWHLESSEKLGVNTVRNWGGDPLVEAEYGVKTVEHRTYSLYPENKSVEAIFENAPDVSSAYGLLTFYQTESMTTFEDLPLTLVGKDAALMARGQTFIRIAQPPGKTKAESDGEAEFTFTLSQLRSLLLLVGGPGASAGDLRNLPGRLPTLGLIQGTEKYLLGMEAARRVIPSFRSDLVGFSQGAEVRMAHYRVGNSQVRVLAITYPTPQIARVRFEVLEKLLEVNREQTPAPVYGKRTGSFVILVLDANTATVASKVLDQFKTTGYVTWDERYPGDKSIVLQMVDLVLANLFLTLILAGFSLVGGVAFFITKVVARKWFPKSAWGQPDEATIIKLNLV